MTFPNKFKHVLILCSSTISKVIYKLAYISCKVEPLCGYSNYIGADGGLGNPLVGTRAGTIHVQKSSDLDLITT